MIYQHDYRPGRFQLRGQQKPLELIEAKRRMDEAWFNYDSIIDKRDDHLAVNMEVDQARVYAIHTEQRYHELWQAWQMQQSEVINA